MRVGHAHIDVGSTTSAAWVMLLSTVPMSTSGLTEQACVCLVNPLGPHCGSLTVKLLVNRLRAQEPEVRVVFRGDSDFYRARIICLSQRAEVQYS